MMKTKNWQNLKKQLVGKWRIVKMPDFSKADIDEDGKAYFEVKNGGSGEFQFLLAHGFADGKFKNESGMPVFDFTWDGNDECDEAQGDGWMKLGPDGTAEGEIRFHLGDTYRFRTVKGKSGKHRT